MRVCRFGFDEMVLTGFYTDTHVIPIDQAAEAYSRENDVELLLPSTEDPMDLLPPDGISYEPARELFSWIERLDRRRPRGAHDHRSGTSGSWCRSPIRPRCCCSPAIMPSMSPSAAASPPSAQETFPYVFMKPPSTTLTRPGDPIVLPRISPDHIDWECELGVVIGRRCRHVEEDDALRYIAGYTIVNDISDRSFKPNPDRKPRDRDKFFDWMHGKWHDTFCPMGPCILSADAVPDPQAMPIRLSVNGEVKQNASTAEMVFPVAAIVAFLSGCSRSSRAT